jgi:late competence protein required for DNA uptake (superfamily II DNA/RNA helicase)
MDYEEIKKDEVVLWIKGNKIISAWKSYGKMAIPVKLLKNKTPEEAIEFIKNSDYFCSICAKHLKKNQVELQHFAGTYCKECSEKYKKENSGICSLCREPYWRCYC